MSEQEMQETAHTEDTHEGCSSDCKKKKCFCKKIFNLKGLSLIYKVLAALLVIYLLYILVMIWFFVFKEGAPAADAFWTSVQFTLTYGFYALVMYTVGKVLKALHKIKHALKHK